MLSGHSAQHFEKCWGGNGDQGKHGFFLHGAHDLEVGQVGRETGVVHA